MVCFPSFVLCLSMYYFVYCNNCALKDVNGACWCTCLLVALRVLEICLWPVKTRKNFELFEMHTCLWPGAQICFRHKWKELVTASLLLHCMDWNSCFRYSNEFFPAVFQVLDWSYLVLHFDWKVCNWFPEVIWPRMNWFWGFLFKMASFVDFISIWTEICKDCSIVIIYWRHQFF